MRIEAPLILCLLSLPLATLLATPSVQPSHYAASFNRTLFPIDFVFGAGSSAYQSEGAANTDGRGKSIWDTFVKQHPEKIADHSNGDVADDLYLRYKSDIKLAKEIGLDSFRFSISWPRIFPNGKGKVNTLGVKFYNNLIDEILSNDLKPLATLFHWDFPQVLDDEYGGFLSRKVVQDFNDYADFCFNNFGDRIKLWVTLNEPSMYSVNGYNNGTYAPGRCSIYVGNCTNGDSATEPYIVAHHLLLAHVAAVKTYKNKYQAYQKGQIGITLETQWTEPKFNNAADRKATNRALDFMFGWYAHPITYGDYPQNMRSIVGDRLPNFTKAQSANLKGSYDFLGVNYYTSTFVQNAPFTNSMNRSYSTDIQASLTSVRNGVPVGIPTALSWLYIYPKGLHQLLVYIKEHYKDPPIYINENGVAEANNASKPIKEALKDTTRIKYYDAHLKSVLQAIKDGVKVKGYYAWSLLDDFEWNFGYTYRFGFIYVDFENNLRRYLKYSAYWLKMFLLK